MDIMTKTEQRTERDRCIGWLRDWLPVGSKVYYLVTHRTPSLRQTVSFFRASKATGDDTIERLNYYMGKALCLSHDMKRGGLLMECATSQVIALSRLLHGPSDALTLLDLR